MGNYRTIFCICCGITLLAFCGEAGADPGTIMGPIESPLNGHQYYLLNSGLTWTQAEAEAQSMNAHLVTIRSMAENQWIFQTFDGANKELWIGLHEVGAEGNFVWSSGEPVVFTNWGPGEPNNMGGWGNEDSVHMRWPGAVPSGLQGTWNDYPDSAKGDTIYFYGVVEVVPEPVSLSLMLLPATVLLRKRQNRIRRKLHLV